MKVPHDIDQLMWTVAESGNASAREDFQHRFPELQSELLKRSTLVDGLREARALHIPPMTRPAFRPMANASRPFYRGKMALGLALFAGLALASAGYVAIYGDHSELPSGTGNKIPHVAACRVPAPKAAEQKKQAHYALDAPMQPTTSPVIAPDVDDARPFRKCFVPQTLALRQVQLSTAITFIAGKSGLTVESPPDMPNPTIDIDYKDRGGLQMLKDLGQQYGFAVVDDGPNKVLLIPQTKG